MLIYEKVVEGTRHLYGTMGNIPSAADSQLTYVDADGDPFTPSLNDTYLDDGKGGIIRKSDGKFVAVKIGNNVIIPNSSWTPMQKTVKSIKVTKKPTKLTYAAGESLDLTGMVVTATYESGDVDVIEDGYTSAPEAGATLTTADDKVTITYEGKTSYFSITVTDAE